jgi:hypothetical protein
MRVGVEVTTRVLTEASISGKEDLRHVPMTERLATALKADRHLRGKRVLVQSRGEPLTMKIVQDRVASHRDPSAQRSM